MANYRINRDNLLTGGPWPITATGDQADNETVFYIQAIPGDRLNMWASTNQTIVIGDPLVSDGAGNLSKHTPQAVDEAGSATFTSYLDAIVGYAAAAVTTTTPRARLLVDIA